MPIYVVGDLHLERHDGIIPGYRRGTKLQLACVDKVLKAAARDKAENVVFLGDVFDTPDPRQSTLVSLLEVLDKYPKQHFHFILGNHDAIGSTDVDTESARYALEVFAWLARNAKAKLTVYTEPALAKLDGVTCWFCPHPHIADAPANAKLAFGHFGWAGAKRDNGSTNNGGSSPKGNWLLGDYHTPQVGKRFQYAGSLTQITFGESKDKSYIVITDAWSIITKPAPKTYIFEKAEVSSKADYAALRATKVDSIPKFYSVDFSDGFVPPAEWQKELPNVIRHTFSGVAAAGDTKASLMSLVTSSDTRKIVISGLKRYLANRGLTNKQVNEGLLLVKNIAKTAVKL